MVIETIPGKYGVYFKGAVEPRNEFDSRDEAENLADELGPSYVVRDLFRYYPETHEIVPGTMVNCIARFTCRGEVREQPVNYYEGEDFESVKAEFEAEGSTWHGWEDGIGNDVCWDNATPVEQ